MEITSNYNRNTFIIDETDSIMWNGHIYQLMTNREDDNTYPVLKENEVRKFINSGELKKVDEYVTDFTRVRVTFYKQVK